MRANNDKSFKFVYKRCLLWYKHFAYSKRAAQLRNFFTLLVILGYPEISETGSSLVSKRSRILETFRIRVIRKIKKTEYLKIKSVWRSGSSWLRPDSQIPNDADRDPDPAFWLRKISLQSLFIKKFSYKTQ